jgi:hypothetical protein
MTPGPCDLVVYSPPGSFSEYPKEVKVGGSIGLPPRPTGCHGRLSLRVSTGVLTLTPQWTFKPSEAGTNFVVPPGVDDTGNVVSHHHHHHHHHHHRHHHHHHAVWLWTLQAVGGRHQLCGAAGGRRHRQCGESVIIIVVIIIIIIIALGFCDTKHDPAVLREGREVTSNGLIVVLPLMLCGLERAAVDEPESVCRTKSLVVRIQQWNTLINPYLNEVWRIL